MENIVNSAERENPTTGVSLFDIIFEIRQRIKLIVGVILICLGLSVLYTQTIQKKEYVATSSVMLYAASGDGSGAGTNPIQYSILIMTTLKDFIVSRSITEKSYEQVANQYGKPHSNSYGVNVSFNTNSLVAYITVTASHPDDAWRLASAYANQASLEAQTGDSYPAMRDAKISVLDDCNANNVSISRHLTRNVIIGFAAGTIISAAYILLKLMLNNTFTKIEEIEHLLKLPVLSSVPKVDFQDDENRKRREK